VASSAPNPVVDPHSSPADELRLTVHRIRTDTLLWNLRAFDDAEPRYRSGPYSLYTPDQIRMIKHFARSERHYGDGRLQAMAVLLGISSKTLSVQIFRVRTGRTPSYWKGIEP
jgi:hypothetical protein